MAKLTDEEAILNEFGGGDGEEETASLVSGKTSRKSTIPQWQATAPPGVIDKVLASRPVQFVSNFFGSSSSRPGSEVQEEETEEERRENTPSNRRAKRFTCACACVLVLIGLVGFIIFVSLARSAYGKGEEENAVSTSSP